MKTLFTKIVGSLFVASLVFFAQPVLALDDSQTSVTCLCYMTDLEYKALCAKLQAGEITKAASETACREEIIPSGSNAADACAELAKKMNKDKGSGVAVVQCEETASQSDCKIKGDQKMTSQNFGECVQGPAKVGSENKPEAGPGTASDDEVIALAQSELNRIGTTDVRKFLGNTISVIMGIMGSIALAMFVYAGFLFMMSGTSDSVEKARSILVWSSMGIVVVFASYALVQLIFATF